VFWGILGLFSGSIDEAEREENKAQAGVVVFYSRRPLILTLSTNFTATPNSLSSE
jgi:hypothetical protein